jgi:tetratricopeptide (TPR) repeat protein
MKLIKKALSVLVVSVSLLLANAAFAQEQPEMAAAEGPLGKVEFHISCGPEAQNRFNRALALLHNMMYRQAEKEFRQIAKLDPVCAMAHWGVAMTLFNPLWAEPKEDELKRGWKAVIKAGALKPPTAREQGYVAAVRAFFENWQTVDHAARIAAWEAAQKKVHLAYPDDVDAGALYALAHLATAPKADTAFSHQEEAGALMEKLRAGAPEHPGVFHYTIHAYDNPRFASRALEVARGYLKLAPDVPHAQHMPSHIFVRMGLWSDSIEWNARSAAAAMRQSGGEEVSLHYIHAMDYLIYAYLQRAEDDRARAALAEVNAVERYQDSFVTAYAVAAAQGRYPLERRKWREAAALPLRTHAAFPWDKYPWLESMTYFARGLGAARSGDASAARKAAESLDALYELSVKARQDYWAVLADAQRKTVAAWTAYAEGKKNKALGIMRKAADIEDSVDKHPVTPGAVLPARELLGDMLMLMGKPGEALAAYEASLGVSPNRFNSLYGAANAAEIAGDIEKAGFYYSTLVQITMGVASNRPRLTKAKAFVSEKQE